MDRKPAFGDLYLVRTKSLFGKLVRFWTRSKFSHGGIVIWGNKGVEATWRGVRVVQLSDYEEKDITLLAPVVPLSKIERRALSKFLWENLDKAYDFGALLGFVLFKKRQDPKRFYCFELQYRSYEAAGRSLARLDNNFIDGSTIYGSLALKLV